MMRAWARARLPSPPRALRVVATNAALIAIAGPLFFGPADTTGFAGGSRGGGRGRIADASCLRLTLTH